MQRPIRLQDLFPDYLKSYIVLFADIKIIPRKKINFCLDNEMGSCYNGQIDNWEGRAMVSSTDCKSAVQRLCQFDSNPSHQAGVAELVQQDLCKFQTAVRFRPPAPRLHRSVRPRTQDCQSCNMGSNPIGAAI